LQDVRGEIGLAIIELAPFAGAHDLAGISDRGGPVKALVERIAHEGAGCGVVDAYARVYIPEELAPLGDGHASLQDAGGGALVQFAVARVKVLAILETNRISANGNPTLSTSVVVPGGATTCKPCLSDAKVHTKRLNRKEEYNIYFITLIRVQLFGTCRVQVHRD
jgi:hypothetical protein